MYDLVHDTAFQEVQVCVQCTKVSTPPLTPCAPDTDLLSIYSVSFLFQHREERGAFIRRKYVDKEFAASVDVLAGQRITSDV